MNNKQFSLFLILMLSLSSCVGWIDMLEISKQLSPLYHVTGDDPPILIAHGDADRAVPLQQSQKIIEKLKQNQVPNQLLIRKGADHGWPDEQVEAEQFAAWFDQHLK